MSNHKNSIRILRENVKKKISRRARILKCSVDLQRSVTTADLSEFGPVEASDRLGGEGSDNSFGGHYGNIVNVKRASRRSSVSEEVL